MQRSRRSSTPPQVRIPPDPAYRSAADIHQGWIDNVLRAMDGISARELARRCGVASTTIDRFLSGERTPSDELKVKIAGALHVRLCDLWAWPSFTPTEPDVAA